MFCLFYFNRKLLEGNIKSSFDLHGEREMPELRTGVRQARLKSKRETELQADNLPPPTNNRRRGGGTGRGRGRSTRAKGTPTQQAAPARQRGGATGTGRAIPVIDLESDKNLEAVPGTADGVVGKPVGMEGGSGEKMVGGEEEGTTPPVPDRV
jgi:hypothetical protein